MDNIQFQRRGVQNRNKIKTQRGEQWLTVPVCHKTRDQEQINEMQINNEQSWAQKQLGSIVTKLLEGTLLSGLYYRNRASTNPDLE